MKQLAMRAFAQIPIAAEGLKSAADALEFGFQFAQEFGTAFEQTGAGAAFEFGAEFAELARADGGGAAVEAVGGAD
jgi:hypothetical protein